MLHTHVPLPGVKDTVALEVSADANLMFPLEFEVPVMLTVPRALVVVDEGTLSEGVTFSAGTKERLMLSTTGRFLTTTDAVVVADV